LRVSPVAAAVSTLIFSASGTHAQQEPAAKPPAATLETVVITGIRRGIETSVATKRNSDSIVEAVSAEDIGKLPDTSIAEALSRLPGLTSQRVDGRPQSVQIRGLSGNYVGTLLNGREMVSTSDNRGVEFDQFPSELLGGVLIYKTPDATLIGQGLAGTVDLQTVRPLKFSGRQLAVNLRGEHNAHGQVTPGPGPNGARFSVSYIDQFADRTIGVALGYAHLDSPGQEQHYKSWWWADTGVWGRKQPGAPAGTITLNGFEATATASKQTRDGLMAVVEYKPNKDFNSIVDLYYSTFDQKRSYRALMSNLGPTWNDATEPKYSNTTVSTVNGDSVVTGATISNLKPVHLSQFNTRKDDIAALGWKSDLKLGDWLATADLSASRAKRSEQFLELSAGAPGATSVDINVAANGGISQIKPALDYANPANLMLGDPGGWGRDGRSNYPTSDDRIKALRLGVGRDLSGVFSKVEAGVNFNERSKEVDFTEFYYNLKNGRTPVAVPANFLLAPTPLSFAGIPGVMSYDVNGVASTLYDIAPNGADQISGRHYKVTEKLSTAFVKVGIDTEVFGVPLRGNFGVQAVSTKQHSEGFIWDTKTKTAVPIAGGKSYTDVLPSLNLAAEMRPDLIARFGAAQTVARPRMEDMRAGFKGISLDPVTGYWSASGGNPGLEPWRADSVDLSLEKYLGKRSYVAGAVFHKHLKNFIYNQTIPYDFTGFPSPTGQPPVNGNYQGVLDAPTNGNGGMVAGTELSASLDAGLFSKTLDGLGLIVSVSRTRSNLHEGNNTDNALEGLSGTVSNMTVYYERSGFSARISGRHRSAFESATRGVFYSPTTSKIEAETVVDAQIGYTFESGPLKGLGLLFQVTNLTDEPYRTRVSSSTPTVVPKSTLPERYTTYGRQYLFGVNYKL
jgi:iron complex outermembrane receptor protein